MSTVLGLVGLVLQVVGASIALHGLVKTHDANADQTIGEIIRSRLAHLEQRVSAAARRLLRRPAHREVRVGEGAIGFAAALDARGLVGWAAIAEDIPDREAIRVLDQRVLDLLARVQRVDRALLDTTAETRTAIADIRRDLDDIRANTATLVRRKALEGLAQEAAGLVLVTVGALVQSVGFLL